MQEPTTSMNVTREHVTSQTDGLRTAQAALTAAEGMLRSTPEPACCNHHRQYQQLQELLPDVYLLTDRTGVIQEANAAVSALFGGARTYIIGKPVRAFVHTEDRASVAARLATFDGTGPDRPVLWRGRLRARRHGEVPQISARISPLADTEGTITGLQWLLRDVTAELAQSERLLSLEQELEQRVRTRTAELAAVVSLQSAQLAQYQPPR